MHLRAFYALQSFQERDLVASMNSVAFGWSRIDQEGQFTLQGDEYRLPAAAGDVTPQSIVANAEIGRLNHILWFTPWTEMVN